MTTHRKGGERGAMFDDTPRGLLEALLIGGAVVGVLTFAPTLLAVLAGIGYVMRADDRAGRRKLNNSFQYLKRKKYVRVVTKRGGKDICIELTEKGKRHAARTQLKRDLIQPIARPRMWDKCWRIIIFDISAEERSKRSAFRNLIRRLGAVMLQKSVWVYPFDCTERVGLLQSFFDFTNKELRVIVAKSVGDDASLRKHFKLL